jgi:molybdenum cofactor sulfurtransferase
MVCVDQESAEKNGEPFVTLAKTRRVDGRVLFGVHTALAAKRAGYVTIRAGDMVETFGSDGEVEL